MDGRPVHIIGREALVFHDESQVGVHGIDPGSPTLTGRPRRTLWVANGGGGGARPLAHGPVLEPLAFQDEGRLLYRQYSRDGAGLGWLDVSEQPVRERPLAEHVVGEPHLLGRRWVLQIADQRAQDGTGTLTLIDVESGRSWAIASAVSRLFGQALARFEDEGATISVVYQVRQPVASSADGLWMLRLRPRDLP
jgi:hypothetical protein